MGYTFKHLLAVSCLFIAKSSLPACAPLQRSKIPPHKPAHAPSIQRCYSDRRNAVRLAVMEYEFLRPSARSALRSPPSR